MVTEPESMEQLVYFTQRSLGTKGNAKAWVYKGDCPKCGKGKMGKPVDEKTGKAKIRSKEYVCPACNYTVEKKVYEDTLECEIKYVCPECGNQGEVAVPYKRKSFNGMKAVVFQCGKCKAKLGITKKLKEKGGSDED